MKLKLKLWNDGDCENPCQDSDWKVYSFSRKHNSFRNPSFFFVDSEDQSLGLKPELLAQLDEGETAFALSYYEHGNALWSLANEGPTCQFDSVKFAGFLIWEGSIEDLANWVGPIAEVSTKEERKKQARQFLDMYTKWINGSVYGYTLEDAENNEISSCSGCYNIEEMAESIREEVRGQAELKIEGDAAWLANHYDFTSTLNRPNKG